MGGERTGEAGGEENPSSFAISVDIFPDKRSRVEQVTSILTRLTILSRSCGCGSKVRLRLSEADGLRHLGDAEVSQQSRAIARVAGAGVGPGVAQDLGLGARPRGGWVSLGPMIGQMKLSD